MILKKKVFDLNTFSEIPVGIEFTPSADFTSMDEALAYVGNDEAKFLKFANDAKAAAEEKEALKTPIAQWHSFVDSDDVEEETVLNGPANISDYDEDTVHNFVLGLAKQQYGYARGRGGENNRAAYKNAQDYIKSNPELHNAVKQASAAMCLLKSLKA